MANKIECTACSSYSSAVYRAAIGYDESVEGGPPRCPYCATVFDDATLARADELFMQC